MEYVKLGRTELSVSRTSFGVLPLQRVDMSTAAKILRKAYDNAINFYDTARNYTDSEEKIGHALASVRKDIVIATKTKATTVEAMQKDMDTSLNNLKTDYVDIYQFHDPKEVPLPGSPLYEQMLKFKKEGKVRFIGFTSHSLDRAIQATESGAYDTMQFPFSALSAERDHTIVEVCKQHNVGFIAMKAMAGGLIRHVAANFSYIRRFENVVPIWGIQREEELDEFLALENNPPVFDTKLEEQTQLDRQELSDKFCRGCGYCEPCPVGIPLNMACRMDLFLTRGPWPRMITPEWQQDMRKILDCTNCKACAPRCPYNLVPYEILKYQYEFYENFVREKEKKD